MKTLALKNGEYIATVTSVRKRGPQGPFAFVNLHNMELKGDVTVSLQPKCWEGGGLPPKAGDQIVVWNLRKQSQWRANNARFLTPEDEEG